MALSDPTTEVDCSCSHSMDCNCECHGRHCDPTEHTCSIEFLPDEGGLTPWGCRDCTPGEGIAHLAGCPVVVAATSAEGVVELTPQP